MTDTANTNEVPAEVEDKPVAKRDAEGKFLAGVSGNPAGRAKGSKNRITLARLMLEEQLRDSLQDKGAKLLNKAVRMALKGDPVIMRVLLDKMLATPRGDDSGDGSEKDIQIVIQNLTNPTPPLLRDEGSVVVTIPPSKGDKSE